MHWMLIDLARRVRPELDESRGRLRCAAPVLITQHAVDTASSD